MLGANYCRGVTSLFPGLSALGRTRRDLGAKACYFWASALKPALLWESLLLSWLTQEGSHAFPKDIEVQAVLAWAALSCLDIDCGGFLFFIPTLKSRGPSIKSDLLLLQL